MAYMLEVDQPTAGLIVQIQLQDAGLYSEISKGKSRDPTDEELAFQLQNEQLEEIFNLLKDRRMAMSFAAAVQADGRILAQTQVEEETASKDRDIAGRGIDGDHLVSGNDFEAETAGLDDETLAKLEILYVSGLEGYYNTEEGAMTGAETEQAESSAWAARRPRQSRSQTRQCVGCGDDAEFFNVARVPCQHEYCRSCLEALFKASITDESLFPPRCCRQPINLSTARIFLKFDLVQLYEKKKVEFETPNRTYCYSTECSVFIGESHIDGEVATCPDCQHTTCTNCKGRAHTGDCPNDSAMQQLLSAAQENGWQRCYSCWRLVELDHGCNHMTCRCGAEFCYNCGEKWKNCACEQWDEHRLLARAYQIVDREAGRLPAANPPPDIHEYRLEDQLVPDIDEPHIEIQETQPDEPR
ncbi:IBR finger domain protein, partial [Penicillium fimorum]